MAIKHNISNIFKTISTLSPLLISFFFLLTSIINQNFKGLIYLLGVIIMIYLNTFALEIFSKYADDTLKKKRSITCGLLDFPRLVPQKSIPCTSTTFHIFTIMYVLFSMIYSNEYNPFLLIVLSVIFVIDIVSRLFNKCTNYAGVVIGIFFGLLYAAGWFGMWFYIGDTKFIYGSDLVSNKLKCQQTSKKFICKKRSDSKSDDSD